MIEDFEIEKTLNESKFSKVVLAKHKLLNEPVTIKILNKHKLSISKNTVRIRNEIKILESINHPNLLKLYQVIEDNNNYYLVTKFANGGELFETIVRQKRISENQASIFFTQLIYALEYLESKHIAHRDIKPENLLLNNENELVLIDFGLSRFYKTNEMIGTPCGSPCYAAPEVLLCPQYNGIMSDIWSCGVVLYAMVCGYLPYEEEGNNEKLYTKILSTKYEVPDELSSNLKDLLYKLLIINPDKRLTLDEIKQHSFLSYGTIWYNEHFKKIKELYVLKEENININIIKMMYKYGIKDSKQKIINEILLNKKNKITTIYYLLIQKFGAYYGIKKNKNELKDKHVDIVPVQQKIIHEENDNKTLLLTDLNIENNSSKLSKKINFRPKTEKIEKKTRKSLYCSTEIESSIKNDNSYCNAVVNLNKNYNIMINNFNTSLNRNTLNKMCIPGNNLNAKLIANNTVNNNHTQINKNIYNNDQKNHSNTSLVRKWLNKIGTENTNAINSYYDKETSNLPLSIANSSQTASSKKLRKKLGYVPKFWPYNHNNNTDVIGSSTIIKKHSTRKASKTCKYFSSPKNKSTYNVKPSIRNTHLKNQYINPTLICAELAENRRKIMSNRTLVKSADNKTIIDGEISSKNNFSISKDNLNPFAEKRKNEVISQYLIVKNKTNKIKLKKKKGPRIATEFNLNSDSSKFNKKVRFYQTTLGVKPDKNKLGNTINNVASYKHKKNRRVNSNVETLFYNHYTTESKDFTEKTNSPKNSNGYTILIPTFLEGEIIEKNIKSICKENKVELIVRKENILPFFICYKDDIIIRIEIIQKGGNKEIKISQIKGDIMKSKNFIKKVIISVGL